MNTLSEHIVSGYDDDLEGLTQDLRHLARIVSTMTSDALKAIQERDPELASDVITRDKKANALQEKVDESATRLIALRHPMATDLRRVIGATRVASDLERVGDLAEGIARRAVSIGAESKISLTQAILDMGALVDIQLAGSITALLEADADAAMKLWLSDSQVDDMYNAIFDDLLAVMMKDARKISTSTDLLFVAKNLERIADHATNICEAIYFVVNGTQLVNDPVITAHFAAE